MSTTEALELLIDECEAANRTALSYLGVGLIDIKALESARAALAATSAPAERDVTKILLEVVPGEDGMGHEVYATCVGDVESVLTRLGERVEELEGRLATSAPAGADDGWPVRPSQEEGRFTTIPFDDGYAEGWARCLQECKKVAVLATSAPSEPAVIVRHDELSRDPDGDISIDYSNGVGMLTISITPAGRLAWAVSSAVGSPRPTYDSGHAEVNAEFHPILAEALRRDELTGADAPQPAPAVLPPSDQLILGRDLPDIQPAGLQFEDAAQPEVPAEPSEESLFEAAWHMAVAEAESKCAHQPSELKHCIASLIWRRARATPAAEVEERRELSDAEIEELRKATFSTENPFCPVDAKSMRKAARAVERFLAKSKEKAS